MKRIIYFLIIVSFVGCNHKKDDIVMPKKVVTKKEPVYVRQAITRKDSLYSKSKAFIMNGIECYWKFESIVQDKASGFGIFNMILIDNKSGKTLLVNNDIGNQNRIDTVDVRLDNFKDVNFDHLKDFVIHNEETSGVGNESFGVFLFDKKKKRYILSTEFSGTNIDIDTIARTVSYAGKSGFANNYQTIKHFDKKGRIEFAEDIFEDILDIKEKRLLVTTTKKIKDKKVIKTTIDTTEFEGY